MTNRNHTHWGPTGKLVYERTYRREGDHGPETWDETVARVVDGNMGLVDERYHLEHERDDLDHLIATFGILPAGRHLWASGVTDRQYLFNCWHAGWDQEPQEHFRFTFLRLMEGGGVGANYSTEKVAQYGAPVSRLKLQFACDPGHEDYDDLVENGFVDPDLSYSRVSQCMSVGDSREGWAAILSEVIREAWEGNWGGITTEEGPYFIDLSKVRPKGSPLLTYGGTASGPVPLARMLSDIADITNHLVREDTPMTPLDAMAMDHAVAKCVVAGGVRRSARMSILPWDDPQIFEFIECKSDYASHWSTNISVAVDDDFYRHVSDGDEWAVGVLESVSHGMLTNGEPGIWNHSLSQEGEHGRVDSTNPCGEIPLEEWEACNLGHINLEYFAPKNPEDGYDVAGAVKAARLITRFLMRATYGDIEDVKSRQIMDRNRRIGVGITGFQSALALSGIPFSESWNASGVQSLLNLLKDTVKQESFSYARQLRIPAPIKTTTVAPTGTISKLAGVTEGIHPIYARHFIRRIRFSELRSEERDMVEEYRAQGYDVEPDEYAANTLVVSIPTKEKLVEEVEALGYPGEIVESADEISLDDMLSVQAVVQLCWADNAVSFTANVDPEDYTVNEIFRCLDSFGPLLKGTTIMPRNDSRPQAPYEAISEAEYNRYAVGSIGESIDESCATGACPVR